METPWVSLTGRKCSVRNFCSGQKFLMKFPKQLFCMFPGGMISAGNFCRIFEFFFKFEKFQHLLFSYFNPIKKCYKNIFPLFLKKQFFKKKFQIDAILWFFNVVLWDWNMKTTNIQTFQIWKKFENSVEISGENHTPRKQTKYFFWKFHQNFLVGAEISGRKCYGQMGTPKRSPSDFNHLEK